MRTSANIVVFVVVNCGRGALAALEYEVDGDFLLLRCVMCALVSRGGLEILS